MAFKMKCEFCKKNIDAAASRCPYCQGEYTPEQVAARKNDGNKNMALGCVGVLVLVALVGMCSGGSGTDTASPPEAVTAAQTALSDPAPAQADDSSISTLTGPQNNAVRSAQSYLKMSGFSRDGLIEQLSSNAGEGYDRADAVAAVDSLTVDWNSEAAESAKSYIAMSGFSCSGLIQQLSSRAGEKFTKSQATYGAKEAGAC